MENHFFDKQTKGIVLCSFLYLLASGPVFLLTWNFVHIVMVWNLFLALLPLVFAKLLQINEKNPKKVKTVIFAFLWLFFFPNAPYLLTDFIHISTIKYYSMADLYSPIIYSTDIVPWIKLVHIGFGALLGTLSGLFSLYIIHRLLIKARGKTLANLIIVMASILSGYGIYIGRFLRFNSWDILRPFSLLSELARSFTPFTLSFSLLFAIYILASYCAFYVFYHGTHQDC